MEGSHHTQTPLQTLPPQQERGRAEMAVKVYGLAASPYIATVLLCLEEVGAEYELVPVDLTTHEQKTAAHLARNPFGKIPAFQDGELMLFESRAISRYILRKYKSAHADLLKEGNPKDAAIVDVWLEVEAHQYHPPIGNIVRQCIFEPLFGGVRDQMIVDENLKKLKKVLEVYEAQLSKFRYLAGDSVSFADLNHFPFTHYFMATEYASVLDSFPHVKAWWEDLLARPSLKKVVTAMPFGLA